MLITDEQKEKLLLILKYISRAEYDAVDALETTFMSDAKSSVLNLERFVKQDQVLTELQKNGLLDHLAAASSAILIGNKVTGRYSEYDRAGYCLEHLSKAKSHIDGILEK